MYCWVDGESPLLWGETDSVKFLPCSSYLMSIIKFSKCAIQLINSQIGHFFWDNTEEKHKYHLANWQMISQEKECGGMGVPDLRDLNLCLLASWIPIYSLSEHDLWSKIINTELGILISFVVQMLEPLLFGKE